MGAAKVIEISVYASIEKFLCVSDFSNLLSRDEEWNFLFFFEKWIFNWLRDLVRLQCSHFKPLQITGKDRYKGLCDLTQNTLEGNFEK